MFFYGVSTFVLFLLDVRSMAVPEAAGATAVSISPFEGGEI
jgi:hypothetical protein